MATSTSDTASKHSSKGSRRRGETAHDGDDLQRLCTFEEGGARYGLDVSLVGEVLVAERIVPVALTPPAVLGVFNCRGMPVPLVDLRAMLGLASAPPKLAESAQATALLVRHGDIQVGIRVERVEAVVKVGKLLPKDDRVDPHIDGLMEAQDASAPVQVLSQAFVLERLKRLRMRAQ